MKMKRIILLLLVVILVTGIFVSCAKPSSTPAKSAESSANQGSTKTKEEVTVALTLPFYNDPFFIEMRDVVESFCKERGWGFAEFDGASDPAKQANGIDNFISSRVTALVICAVDSDAIVASINKANEAGIPVFTVDTPVNGGDVVCHIGTDNYQAGEVCAEWVVDNITNRPVKVAVGYCPTAESTRQRYKGFKDYLSNNNIEYEIIDEQKGVSVDEGLKMGEAWAASTAKEADVVYATDDNTGYGVMQALVDAGINNVPVTSVDGQSFIAQAMLDGKPYGCSAAQRPGLMGQLILEAVERHLNGQNVPKIAEIPAFAITAENAAEIIKGEGYPEFKVDWEAK